MVDDLYEDETLVTDEYIATVADRMGIPEEDVAPMDDSILAKVGNAVSFIFKPLGFGSWKPTVATVTGLVAKEEVVGTFGVLYNYDAKAEQAVDEETGELLFDEDGEPIMAELSEDGDEIWDNVAEDFEKTSNGHGQLAAFAFMLFNLLCAPCFAAMGAIKREMNNGKWTAFAITYMCVFAYVIGLIVYRIGLLFSGEFGVGTVVAILLIAFLVWALVRKAPEDLTAVPAKQKA